MELRGTVLNVVDFGAVRRRRPLGQRPSPREPIERRLRPQPARRRRGGRAGPRVGRFDRQGSPPRRPDHDRPRHREKAPAAARTRAPPQTAAAKGSCRRRGRRRPGRTAAPSAPNGPAASARGPSDRSAATTATAARRSEPAPTKSAPPKRSSPSPKKWKRAKSTSAPSATCYNSTRRNKNQKRTTHPPPTTNPILDSHAVGLVASATSNAPHSP